MKKSWLKNKTNLALCIGIFIAVLTLSFALAPSETAFAEEPTVWDGTTADISWYVGHESATTYEIDTPAKLAGLARLVNGTATGVSSAVDFEDKTITLTMDIVLNESLEGTPKEWTAIGTSFSKSFQGTFDGNNRTISGIYINKPNADYQGLFGYVYEGTIQNLNITKSSITGESNVGGIAGYNNCGTIQNCQNAGEVSGKDYVGGIAGYSKSESVGEGIINCYNTGDVTATGSYAGGIVGCYESGRTDISFITNCYNTGNVKGVSSAGGVIGNPRGPLAFSNCYVFSGVKVHDVAVTVDTLDDGCKASNNAIFDANGNFIVVAGDREINGAITVCTTPADGVQTTLLGALNAYVLATNEANEGDDEYIPLETWAINAGENSGYDVNCAPVVFGEYVEPVEATEPTIILDLHAPEITIEGEIATITDLNLQSVTVAGKEVEVTANEMQISLSDIESGEHEIVASDKYGRTATKTFTIEKVEVPKETTKPEVTKAPEPTQKPTIPTETEKPEATTTPEKPEKSGTAAIPIALAVLVVGGGAGYYFVKVKGKR